MRHDMIPAKEFARTETVTITPVIRTAPMLEPGRYWVGPISGIFPSALNWLFPVGEMVREALDAVTNTGAEAGGAVFQYGDTRVPFLAARVADGRLDFRITKGTGVVEASVRGFCAETYIVVVSFEDANLGFMEDYLRGLGAFFTVRELVEPVLAPNSVRLVHHRPSGPEVVFEVYALR